MMIEVHFAKAVLRQRNEMFEVVTNATACTHFFFYDRGFKRKGQAEGDSISVLWARLNGSFLQ
jgi:hypothetical protein